MNSKLGCHFKICTLERIIAVVKHTSLFKCRPDGDKLLVCPWGVVRSTRCDDNEVIPTDSGLQLQPGRKLIPLPTSDSMEVFIPCLPDQNDEGPQGFCENNIVDIIDINLYIIPLTGYVDNVIIYNGDSYFSLKPRGQLKENDILCVSGKRYRILSVGPDAFRPSHDLISIGFRNKFYNSNKKRSVRFDNMPVIMGKIDMVKLSAISIVDPASFVIKNVNKCKHGMLSVSFENAVFNDAGYLTHEISIPIGEL